VIVVEFIAIRLCKSGLSLFNPIAQVYIAT